MEVVLLQRVPNLGQIGDVVEVAGGYGRNYLLPRKLALRANKENLAIFENRKQQIEADNLARRKEADAVAKKMDGLSVIVIRSASDSGHLYGSVRAGDVAKAVTAKGFSVTRNQVEIIGVIKELGMHSAKVRLHPEVDVTVSINVALSEEEAAIQADKKEPDTE